jgi:hypothetical protein
MALLNHFISSIWIQWVLLQCGEGSVWLILDMSCPHGIGAGQKFCRFKPDYNIKPRVGGCMGRWGNMKPSVCQRSHLNASLLLALLPICPKHSHRNTPVVLITRTKGGLQTKPLKLGTDLTITCA